jgi:hypothetical protein
VLIVLNFGSLKRLEPSGSVKTYNGVALPFYCSVYTAIGMWMLAGLKWDINFINAQQAKQSI